MIQQIEISEFKLRYDGMFHIEFEDGNASRSFRIYLPTNKLFKILRQEGYNDDDISKFGYIYDEIPFKKVVLSLRYSVNEKGKRSYLSYILTDEDEMEFQMSFIKIAIME